MGLGSNSGDRCTYLQSARARIEAELQTTSILTSPIYATAPVEMADAAPPFLNQVIAFQTRFTPLAVHRICLRIEGELGRTPEHEKNSDRTIDIDIITHRNAVVRTPDLVIPHPRYRDRRFVLQPLADILPGFRDPVDQTSISELLLMCDAESAAVAAVDPEAVEC